MNTKQARAKVLRMIPEDFGISFRELKKQIKETHSPTCGSDHFKSKRGYSVFYTDNPNYMQGEANGGGVGYFASLRGVGVSRTIKLSNQ